MYQNYGQTDPRWKNQRLGTVNGVTIGSDGCYVTAFANIASHFRKNVTPASLDDVFTNNHLYVNGDLCTDDMLTKVYSDIKYYGTYHCENTPCDLSVFNEFNNYEREAIICLDASPRLGVQYHFNRFYDYNPATGVVRIVDSEDGKIVSVKDRYGDPKTVIQKVVKYAGPSLFVAKPTVQPVPQAVPKAAAPALPAAPPIQPKADVIDEVLQDFAPIEQNSNAKPETNPQTEQKNYTVTDLDKPRYVVAVEDVPLTDLQTDKPVELWPKGSKFWITQVAQKGEQYFVVSKGNAGKGLGLDPQSLAQTSVPPVDGVKPTPPAPTGTEPPALADLPPTQRVLAKFLHALFGDWHVFNNKKGDK